jgi:parallel beta-helix repeat protein
VNKIASGIMLILFLVGSLSLVFNISLVKSAPGTIYILTDGSIDPPTAPIKRDGNLYTFLADIYDEIIVLRSYATIDGNGYMLLGSGGGNGFYVYTATYGVTIRNTNVKNFQYGIHIEQWTSGSNVSWNTIINNGYGIYVRSSPYNNVFWNTMINNGYGIYIDYSDGSNVSRNTIANNNYGIYMNQSSNNRIYHNSFINNTNQAYSSLASPVSINVWDDGYPSGGNYWSDYSSVDANGDGIWDTPYNINYLNKDNYPLVHLSGCVHNLDTNRYYLTIESAIDAPETLNGHTIFVKGGIYYERVFLSKTLSLVGENEQNTIIDGRKELNVIEVSANNVNITGFTVQKSKSLYSGVQLSSSGCTISDCIIRNNYDGIQLAGPNNTIRRSTMFNNTHYGLYLASYNNIVSGNTITNCSYGIRLEGDYHTVTGNTVTFVMPATGIDLYLSNNNTISGNAIAEVGPGPTWYGVSGIHLLYSDNNTICRNTIANNQYGVHLEASNNNTVSENVITNNKYCGIYFDFMCNHNTVSGNTITKSQSCGILLYQYAAQNNVSGNTITNSLNGIVLEGAGNNTVSGNIVTNSSNYGISIQSHFVSAYVWWWSNYNNVTVNTVTNSKDAIYIEMASFNNVSANAITNSTSYGIYVISAYYTDVYYSSHNNTVSGNTVRDSNCSVRLDISFYNRIYHNNFINNKNQVYLREPTRRYYNVWDDGYPSGGNYWSDYGGTDSDGDGIGDSPYVIDSNNQDNYPLMCPYPFIPGDVNHDGIVNILDATLLGWYWQQTVPPAPANVDINGDGIVNILDATIVGWNWQKHA